MDERRARIYDDLRGIVSGDLYFEPLDRAPYALGAGPFEIDPLGVVAPRSAEDVATLARYATENSLTLHPRGAATDAGGGALGDGLIVDFSRHLRRITAIGEDRVEAEAGVVFDAVNARLAPLGRRLEPTPATSEAATLGGAIGVDASGSRSCRYGPTSRWVERLGVVSAQGETADFGFEPWPAYEDESADFKSLVVRKLLRVHKRRRWAWEARGESGTAASPLRDRAGYRLGEAADDVGVDLARLLCGAEGTLAMVVRATLRTVPLPAATAVVILPFVRLVEAAGCVPFLTGGDTSPTACDLYDWRSVSLARDAEPLFREHVGEAVESVMVVEFEGASPGEVAGRARLLIEKAYRTGLLSADPAVVHRRADCERLVRLRKWIEPLFLRGRGRSAPSPILEDVTVPVEGLAPAIRSLQDVLRRRDLTWTLDVFAAEGRIRMRPFLDPGDPAGLDRLEDLASEFFDVVLEAGGTIAGSQGCGLLRTPFLPRQLGEQARAFRDVKDAFDPGRLLNPGKVVEDARQGARRLKAFPEIPGPTPDVGPGPASGLVAAPEAVQAVAAVGGPASPLILPVLRWPGDDPTTVASSCNGCGSCRGTDPALRMCPSFRAFGEEAASPRALANLVRQASAGMVDPRSWGSAEFLSKAGYCIHCKLCQTECPAGVDVSSLVMEAKAAFVEDHGLAPQEWIFSRLEMWARLASRFPIVSNFLMSRRGARWLLERALGVSRRRVLPPVRRTPFTRRAAKLGLHRPRPSKPGPRVVYFVDVYANYYDHELAESVVGVLQQAEVNVYVPPSQRSSGMAPLVVGDVDHARELALRNLRVLGDAVRDGYTVVCSEPTAALMLRQEYVKLTDDLDAALVAQSTMDLGQYLQGLDARGQLPAPGEPVRARVGYHQPCHLRALEVGLPGFDLLRKVPELDVEFINRGCSGMGGTFGLRRDQFRASLRAGRGLHKRLMDDDIEIGSTECGACRIQMEQGLSKRTLHPIKLLALAYGLNPSLRLHFKDPKPRHAMS
ncbi:FAD-binding and (Fe-S)-binding domain-containing protein [Planctomyces sp. SH-PL62]|uniref:FAD-binding and (Fe-S)-binding domain-containing protein n=1 Tax=Planctomyces sp. SH-PL62 TaxID=1636152 RepID=UPI00078D45C0|nr:FAD-binding and (Fe-S)-binding domain-containing protein [Planctomyces sp. SH-PL62]AMV37412.1 Anaerobic glycerol-3-phosphate dehydrogenase subunit C [Planctomyces sp. SH-PL62]